MVSSEGVVRKLWCINYGLGELVLSGVVVNVIILKMW